MSHESTPEMAFIVALKRHGGNATPKLSKSTEKLYFTPEEALAVRDELNVQQVEGKPWAVYPVDVSISPEITSAD